MLVKLAEDIGKLHLTMRSKTDSEPRVADRDRFKPTDMSDFLGDDEEETENKVEDKPQSNDNDLEQFLDANSQPEPIPATLPVVPLPVPALTVPANTVETKPFDTTWKIEIFSGDIQRVEEVKIPESEWPVIEPEVKSPEDDGSGGNPLLKGLKKLFSGNETKNTNGAETRKANQSETLPTINDDQNVEDSIPVPMELPTIN